MKISKLFLALAVAGVVGLVSVDGFAAARVKCPAGTYSKAGASSCTTCDNGYISAEGATQCSKCSTGISNDAHTECAGNCTKGRQWLNGKTCTACPSYATCDDGVNFVCNTGYYKASATSTTCTSCGTGVAKCGTGKTNIECKDGYFLNGTSCTACPTNSTCTSKTDFTCKTGYYKKGTTCTACPANTKSCSGDSFTCNDGYYENGTTCTQCTAGYYCKN